MTTYFCEYDIKKDRWSATPAYGCLVMNTPYRDWDYPGMIFVNVVAYKHSGAIFAADEILERRNLKQISENPPWRNDLGQI